MNGINSEVSQRLDSIFPEPLTQQSHNSEIENKVESCVNRLVLKACNLWETTSEITKSARNVYKAAWIPYYVLKHPFAHRNQLHSYSPEKNLEILTNVTPQTVHQSVITPAIARATPYFSMSAESGSAVSKYLSGATFLYPLVYGPAYLALSSVYYGEGMKTLDPTQIMHDLGNGLQQASSTYQGPEAVVSAVTALAMGVFAGTVSYTLWSLLLLDHGSKERFQTIDKLYTDVVMVLKSQWDEAEKAGNSEEMKKCVLQATKLQTNVELISSSLAGAASLTEAQSKNIKVKLYWGPNYVLSQYKLYQENTQKINEQNPVVQNDVAQNAVVENAVAVPST